MKTIRRFAVMITLGAALAGCAAPAATAPSPPDPMLAFAQCLRDHGVDATDPDASGTPVLDPATADDPVVAGAVEACQPTLPGGSIRPSATAGDQGQLAAFAVCMREHGLPDFPDPEPGTTGGAFAGSGVDRDDPAFQAAAEACRHTLGGN